MLFDSGKRPTLRHVEKVLHGLSDRFQLTGGMADEDGRFESLDLLAPDDYAALSTSATSRAKKCWSRPPALAKELKRVGRRPRTDGPGGRLAKCDARFDMLHFEEMTAATAGRNGRGRRIRRDARPRRCCIVLDALAELTKGIGVDPQSGTLVSERREGRNTGGAATVLGSGFRLQVEEKGSAATSAPCPLTSSP